MASPGLPGRYPPGRAVGSRRAQRTRRGKSRPVVYRGGGSGRLLTRVQIANSVDMTPGLRELIALTLLAGLGCGLALAHGDLLFVPVFGGAIAMTIETIRRFP